PVAVETEDGHSDDDEEDEKRSRVNVTETKVSRHSIIEVKESKRNGVPVGIVAGYLSTWQPDTGGRFGVPDQFVPGAWAESLADHRQRGNRQIRFKDHHGRTIGGFPIETVVEDERGLFAIGEINLTVDEAKEITTRELEKKLHESGLFSRAAARVISSRLGPAELTVPEEKTLDLGYDNDALRSILRDLQDTGAELRKS
ncbi:hypothetical protein LCGC14_3164200, partial [marine sediment metagenome]